MAPESNQGIEQALISKCKEIGIWKRNFEKSYHGSDTHSYCILFLTVGNLPMSNMYYVTLNST